MDAIMSEVAPEFGIPMELGKTLAPHAPTILMIPLVVMSVLLIIVGIIVLSAANNKMPGSLLLVLGFLLGGGAFFVMVKTEGGNARKR
jgi:hypothetical protein